MQALRSTVLSRAVASRRQLCVRAMASVPSNMGGVETATFALGCKKLKGVVKTRVGYTGGKTANPTYESVCRGDGHTEAMRIWFDPSVISYDELLDKFFEDHDPTQRSKCQYKSGVWVHSDEQREAVTRKINELEKKFKVKVATTVDPEQPWYDAEEYHQDYLGKMVGSRWGW